MKKDWRFKTAVSEGTRERALAASRRGECFARMSRAGDRRVGLAVR